jgi:hypothetical protein
MAFTTLENIANQFTNENLRNLFTISFKGLVKIATEKGIDFDLANRMAFDILIKEGGFENLALRIAKQ